MLLDRTRQLYRRLLTTQQPSASKNAEAIQISGELKAIVEMPGWQRLEEFMDRASLGGHELLQYEVQNINGLSLFKFFDLFIKYITLTFENRAYTRIRNYIRVSIDKGQKIAEKIAKAEANVDKTG